MKKPSYYRGRLKLIEIIMGAAKLSDKEYALLRNGYLQESEYQKDIQKQAKGESNKPLDFMETTRFSNWFAMHPEKIAGIEIIGSSKIFPIKVKGKKADIENMFAKELKKRKPSKETEAIALAIALEIELQLLEL